MNAIASQSTKQNILMTLNELPQESLPIVEQFVKFLKVQAVKAQARQATGQVSGLGGLWLDVALDVDVQDIRRLRHELTEAVDQRMKSYGLVS
jgi:hypothetical protein